MSGTGDSNLTVLITGGQASSPILDAIAALVTTGILLIGAGNTASTLTNGTANQILSMNGAGTALLYTSTPTLSGVITGKIYPSTDSTTAVQILKADGVTPIATCDTINSKIGINGAPVGTETFQVTGSGNFSTYILSPTIYTTSFSPSSGNSYTFKNNTSGTIVVFDGANNNLGIGLSPAATAKLDILDTVLAGSGSLAGSVLNLAQTWNTTGTPTAIKLNVTNTASNAASLLMDLQVGGVSKVKADVSGLMNVQTLFVWGGGIYSGPSTLVLFPNGSTSNGVNINPQSAQTFASGYILSLTPTYNQTGTASATDLLINRTETAVGSGAQLLIDAQVGGVSKFRVSNLGVLTHVDGGDIVLGSTTGTKIATATTQKLGFWNATPVVQPASANQAAVATTGATNATPYGFTTAAQADGIVTLLNQIRSDLVAVGILKGAA